MQVRSETGADIQQFPDFCNPNIARTEHGFEQCLKLGYGQRNNVQSHSIIVPVIPDADTERFSGIAVNLLGKEQPINRLILGSIPDNLVCYMPSDWFPFSSFLPGILRQSDLNDDHKILKFKQQVRTTARSRSNRQEVLINFEPASFVRTVHKAINGKERPP
ncbi:hypothetical protein GeomeDRAFT_2931 [Geobacter metallireducens RCH3]|nr:hypothetical protein GeomeDRAFT_2931 [Geobacter metallireducens RCH3]